MKLSYMDIELIEEIGKIALSNIDNVEEYQLALKKAGYVSYLDASMDYLIVEPA